MTDRPAAEEIPRPTFRVAFRGYDQAEVDDHIGRLESSIEELQAQRARLTERLGEFAERDLKREFESVGREVTAVLESARAAAEGMRERATADAARWRSEAMAEVDQLRREARADAEALRSDAWTTGTQLLEQVQAEVERRREAIERESLAIKGEAEREAHRLTAGARREADDLARSSKMEAEKLLSAARADYEEIIASAQRQADAAQERTRALEERRRELMDELESVRGALASMEGELEERRHGIGLSEPTELPGKFVIADEQGEPTVRDWEEGQTVRIIRPDRDGAQEGYDQDGLTDGESLADEVARLHSRAEPEPEYEEIEAASEPYDDQTEPDGGDEPPATAQEETLPETPEELPESAASAPSGEESATEPEPVGEEPERLAEGPDSGSEPEVGEEYEADSDVDDEVADLFARLRAPSEGPTPEGEGGEASPEELVSNDPVEPTGAGDDYEDFGGVDPFETRERLLLPITNAVLRAVKRSLAEAQNQALETLRVSAGDWSPDPAELGSILFEDLETLIDQAAQAGLEAATEMGIAGTGSMPSDLPPPDDLGAELAGAVRSALEAAGSGPRERQAAASRVFRGWRTDEAERRIRMVAFASYHSALKQALEDHQLPWRWRADGRLCSVCRQAAEAAETVPPAHRDCSCTIVPG